jgi:hypothetical protein
LPASFFVTPSDGLGALFGRRSELGPRASSRLLLSPPGRGAFAATLPRGLAAGVDPLAIAEEGLGAALGRSLPARSLSFGRLSGRLLFALGRLSCLPAAGLGAAATAPLGAVLDGRGAALDEGLGLLSESGFLAMFEEGFGALEGPLALSLLLLLFEGFAAGLAAGRGAGAEETLGPVFDGALWRATGRASGFRLLLLLLLAVGR